MAVAGDGDRPILLLVHLFVRPGREGEFRRFETEAAHVMRRHGGRIERVIRPKALPPGVPLPSEIHLVWFPGMGAFEAYRADPALADLATLRQAVITRTEIVVGEEGEPYP
jgi:hypothetical protein